MTTAEAIAQIRDALGYAYGFVSTGKSRYDVALTALDSLEAEIERLRLENADLETVLRNEGRPEEEPVIPGYGSGKED